MALTGLASSCQSAASHQNDVSADDTEKFTLGTVQRKVQIGMTQAEVARSLGSPNIVSKDVGGKEAWIYDKAARDVTYSRSETGVWFIIGAYGKETGAARNSQKTLTVVIKFDDRGLVEDVSYHASQF